MGSIFSFLQWAGKGANSGVPCPGERNPESSNILMAEDIACHLYLKGSFQTLFKKYNHNTSSNNIRFA